MLGVYEIIALALALGGFGVQANPKAPSADTVLEYAVDDADVVAYIDAVPLIPGNYSALKKLPDAPEIKDNPALRDIVGKVIAEVEGARGTVKTMVGVDLTTDLSNLTMFAKLSDPPELLVVARGKFPSDMPARIGKMMGGKPETVGDAQAIAVGGPFELLAVSKSGVLFMGSRALVTARLASTWKAPARPKGSTLAEAAKVLGDKPVYMAAASFASGRMGKMIEKGGGPDAAAMVARFTFLSAAVYPNGVGWVIQDKDADSHARSVMMSEGWVDLMRAAHLAPRGIAKLFLSFIDDIKAADPVLTELKKHKADLLKLVDQFTGDGNFKVKIDNDVKGHRLAVRASGKKLSDVVPVGLVVPGMAFALMETRKSSGTMTGSSTTVAPTPVKPRTGGGISTPPKPTPKPAPHPSHP